MCRRLGSWLQGCGCRRAPLIELNACAHNACNRCRALSALPIPSRRLPYHAVPLPQEILPSGYKSEGDGGEGGRGKGHSLMASLGLAKPRKEEGKGLTEEEAKVGGQLQLRGATLGTALGATFPCLTACSLQKRLRTSLLVSLKFWEPSH